MVRRVSMRLRLVLLAAFAVASGVGVVMWAGAAPSWNVPQTLHYQGRLLDAAGAPVAGTAPITFRIWNDATSIDPADQLWWETLDVELDASGFFEVTLGATSGRGFPADLFEAGPRWLGIEPRSSGELSPRQLVQSVPYALRAGVASGLAEGADIRADSLVLGGADLATELADLRSRLAALEAGIPWTSITGRPGWLVTSGTVVRTQVFRWFGLPNDTGTSVTTATWTTISRRVAEFTPAHTGFEGSPVGTTRRYRLFVHYSTIMPGVAPDGIELRLLCESGWASATLALMGWNADPAFLFAAYSTPFDPPSCLWSRVQARVRVDLYPSLVGYLYAVDLLAEDVVP